MSVSSVGLEARERPEAIISATAQWKMIRREMPESRWSVGTHVCTSCSTTSAVMKSGTHGLRALKMVVTPRTRPTWTGLRMQTKATRPVSARVRTADIMPTGMSQQHATLVAAHATVVTVVCRPTRYKPADEKSMNGSSCERYTSSDKFLSALLMARGLSLAILGVVNVSPFSGTCNGLMFKRLKFAEMAVCAWVQSTASQGRPMG